MNDIILLQVTDLVDQAAVEALAVVPVVVVGEKVGKIKGEGWLH